MKRLFLYLVALMVTTTVFAYDFTVDGLCYNIIDGHYDAADNFIPGTYAKVTYQNGESPRYNPEELNPNLVIPATVEYENVIYKVKWIGEASFEGCAGIKTLTIADVVEKIQSDAFWGCFNLEKVTLPNSLTYIGQGVF